MHWPSHVPEVDIRVDRGLFMQPTCLKLIDFPLAGHYGGNQKSSLSSNASFSNLHFALPWSLSLFQSVQTPWMSSGIMNARWIWRLLAAAHFTASCSNRASPSPCSWGGSLPRSIVQFNFFIAKKNQWQHRSFHCCHRWCKVNNTH